MEEYLSSQSEDRGENGLASSRFGLSRRENDKYLTALLHKATYDQTKNTKMLPIRTSRKTSP